MRVYLDHNATTPLRDEVVDGVIELVGCRNQMHQSDLLGRRSVETLGGEKIAPRIVRAHGGDDVGTDG